MYNDTINLAINLAKHSNTTVRFIKVSVKPCMYVGSLDGNSAYVTNVSFHYLPKTFLEVNS